MWPCQCSQSMAESCRKMGRGNEGGMFRAAKLERFQLHGEICECYASGGWDGLALFMDMDL